MSAIADIFRRFGPAYLARFGATMPLAHRRAINAIIACRSPALGSVCYACADCGCAHVTAASCGNRHCPQCQGRKAFQWLERQMQRQLPGPHFMLTFTVPQALREILRAHQRLGYGALFAASADAIKTLAKDPRHIGGDCCGFFGVLHTWGRQLQYHPHIHYVVAAGAIHREDGRWRRSRDAFFLPVRALSRLFRGKFRALMDSTELQARIPDAVWEQEWNVHCQAVPNASATLNYLAPYVFKVAISDQRILKLDKDQVHIRWRKVGSQRPRTLILDASEFIRRFLTHILPTGFMKIRYYGFLAPTSKITLQQVHLSIQLASAFELAPVQTKIIITPPPTCRECGGPLRFIRLTRPHHAPHTGPPHTSAA